VLIGCDGAVVIRAPALTAVIMDVAGVTVFWEENSEIEGGSDFAGYNVYVYTDSTALMTSDGEELNKFNGQVITDTMFQVNGLSQDSIYFIQVRTVNIEDKVGGYNDTVPFLTASPRPEYVVTMHLVFDTGSATDSCAIRYRDALIVADPLMADSAADMWIRASGDTVWVASPTNHPLYGSGARQTLFVNIGSADFDSIPVVTAEPGMETSEVAVGEIIIAKTVDGNYVKICVEAIDTINGMMTLLYAYQNVVGFPYF
jgi:hypothetical protein